MYLHSTYIISGQASSLDPHGNIVIKNCLLCLKERLNSPTYSDTLDEDRNWNQGGVSSVSDK